MVKGNQLLNATITASLAILLSSDGVPYMYKMPWPKVRVVATKVVAIRAVVVVLVVVMGRLMVEPMLWMPMSSKDILLVSLKRINQDHLIIMFHWADCLAKKLSSGAAPCKA